MTDLIGRRFDPGELAVNTCWAGDITYVRMWEGWMYLATVVDLASRRVVGWAMADPMRAELVCQALEMAIGQRRPGLGLIFHSDRGSQYTSKQFRELLKKHQIRQSVARPRKCWGQRGHRGLLPAADRPLGFDLARELLAGQLRAQGRPSSASCPVPARLLADAIGRLPEWRGNK